MRLIRHTGFFVKDLEEMKSFYCEFFDMEVEVHDIETGDYIANLYGMGECEIQVELYKLSTKDGCMIELLKITPENEIDTHSEEVFNWGSSHVAFTVDDTDKTYEKMKRMGINFFSQPQISRDGMHKVCFCRDPEGNNIELVQDL